MKPFWRHLDFFINGVLCNKAEIADAGRHKRFRFNVQNTKVKVSYFMLYAIFPRKSAIEWHNIKINSDVP